MPTKFRMVTDLLPSLRRKKNEVSMNPLSIAPTEDVDTIASIPEPLAPIVAEPILAEPEPIEVESAPEQSGTSGLHEIIKTTDYWFNMQLSQLEKYALSSASAHAQAGLPRQQAPADEELPAERILRVRAVELFVEWAARVRRKVQDAIQASSVAAGDGIMQFRNALEQLDLTIQQYGKADVAKHSYEKETDGKEKEVAYSRQIPSKPFYALLVLLTLVDWVANVPVFAELLPREAGSDQRWEDLVAATEHFGAWSGMASLWHRIIFYPEVSLLALGVVIFLMFLGHIGGKSLRRIASFSFKSDIAPVLKAQRRQAWIPCAGAALGMIILVTFLFISRGRIKEQTELRFNDANKQVEILESQEQQAKLSGDADKIAGIEPQLDDAKALQKDLRARVNYATGISAMNFPILLLNFVLAVTAVAAAYLHDEAPLVSTSWADPKTEELKGKVSGLSSNVTAQAASLYRIDASVQAHIARVRYLAQTPPLREWPAKAKRLETIVALFRAENARQRGIDVQNIQAFQREWPLQLPGINENEPFHMPEELAVHEASLVELRVHLSNIQSRIAEATNGVNA